MIPTTLTSDPDFVSMHEYQSSQPYQYYTSAFVPPACSFTDNATCKQQFAVDADVYNALLGRHTRIEENAPGHSLPSTEIYGTAPLMQPTDRNIDDDSLLRGMPSEKRTRAVTETQFYRPELIEPVLEVEPFQRGGELTRMGLAYSR